MKIVRLKFSIVYIFAKLTRHARQRLTAAPHTSLVLELHFVKRHARDAGGGARGAETLTESVECCSNGGPVQRQTFAITTRKKNMGGAKRNARVCAKKQMMFVQGFFTIDGFVWDFLCWEFDYV